MKGDEDEAVEGGWEESQRGMRFADPLPSSGRPVRARAGMGGVSLSLSRPCVCARLSALVLPSRERAVARESSVCCCVRSGQCARLRKQKQKKISFSLSATRHLKKNINRFVSVAAAGHKQPGGHVNSLTTLVWNIVPEPARIVCVWRVLCKEKRRDLLFYCRAQLLTHTHRREFLLLLGDWFSYTLAYTHTHTRHQHNCCRLRCKATHEDSACLRLPACGRIPTRPNPKHTHKKKKNLFFYFPPFLSLSLCVCVPTLHGAYPRTGAKIAAVRYDNSDIAASAYGKMTMVRLCFFVQVSYGHNGLEPISRDMLLCLTKKKNDNDRRAAITQCANRLFVPPVSNCCTYDRRGGFTKGETDGFPISKSELKNSCSVSVICWNLSTCSAIQREREKKNKSVGEECDSTLLVPLASSRTMHFLHPLPPSPKKNLFYR